MHNALQVISVPVPCVALAEVVFLAVLNVVEVNGDVLAPVTSALFVPEPHRVHHLVKNCRLLKNKTNNPMSRNSHSLEVTKNEDTCKTTRGPQGHISCTEYNVPLFLTDRPGRLFLYTHRHEKHKLGGGR